MNYAQHVNPRATPQSEQADERQVENSAGGYTFALDCWKRLERWLILGCEGGTYYASEKKLTREGAKTVVECLRTDGPRTVKTIADVSDAGRAPKNDPAIFALALAAAHEDDATRRAALGALPRVCRIGTHLFTFAEAVNSFRGWGPGLRKAIARWYAEKTPEQLAYQVAKYGQRNGWAHRDILRLAHPEPTADRAAIYRWAAGAPFGAREVPGSEKSKRGARSYGAVEGLPAFLAAFDELKTADELRTIDLIREHGFTHEMIDTRHKSSPDVWAALLEKMPPGALVRNLGKMTEVGLLRPLSASTSLAVARLTDAAALKKARLHPVAMLSALMVYRQGHGEKGKLKWSPVPQVIDALDAGFYESFDAIEPTGARTLLAIDVSGSMQSGTVAGVPGLTPQIGAAAMAMVTARVEKNWHVVAFDHQLRELPITPRMRLDDVVKLMAHWGGGRTDCAQPMLYAAGNSLDVDCFVAYTDNETWSGAIHPHQALNAYRSKSGVDAKAAVVGMTSTGFTIADPSDAGQLDLVGFDTSAPAILADFARVR